MHSFTLRREPPRTIHQPMNCFGKKKRPYHTYGPGSMYWVPVKGGKSSFQVKIHNNSNYYTTINNDNKSIATTFDTTQATKNSNTNGNMSINTKNYHSHHKPRQ